MRRVPRAPGALARLPLRALYPLSGLANAVCVDRRTLKGVLDRAGVRLLQNGKTWWVPLSELELKVPSLWDSIKSAEMLRQLVSDEG